MRLLFLVLVVWHGYALGMEPEMLQICVHLNVFWSEYYQQHLDDIKVPLIGHGEVCCAASLYGLVFTIM